MPRDLKPLKLAQAGDEHAAPAGGETHAATESHAAGAHHEAKLGDIPEPGLLFMNGLVVAILMIGFATAATRKLAAIPRGAQNFGEFITEAMVNFTRGIIGPGGEKYVPLIGSLFFFVYLSNMLGLVPGFHSPSANLSTTLALGLVVFVYVQYVGIKAKGLGGYIKHFMGPMPALAPLLFPIEIISEIVKPFTLAMRLFGNIFGEDTVIIVLASLGVMILPKLPIVPLQFPLLMLALLTCFVQAMVFALLACIYISLATHHEDDHSEHAAAHGHGAEPVAAHH